MTKSTTLSAENIGRLTGALVGTGTTTHTVAPQDNSPLATFANYSAQDVHVAHARAAAAQPAWAATPAARRAAILVRYFDLVLGNRELIDLVQAENGKSRNRAFEETADIAGLALYYGRTAQKVLAPRRRRGAIPGATRTYEHRQPKGVVGIISPWNYPLSLSVGDAIPALVAGNAVLHKLDSQTPLVTLRARELLIEAGLPAEVWQVVVGEPDEVGPALLDTVDHICFTGSTTAGRAIAEHAARRLIGATLELGGKNPMLVFDDADLAKTATGAARACFASAGQLCIATERIYVHKSVYDDFVAKLVATTQGLRLGTGLSWDYDMGSLTSRRMLDRVAGHVADARARGARVLAGGEPRPDIGPWYFEPTVLDGVTPDMAVYAEETFGPVVSLYPFTDDAEAIGLANDTEYGLNASVWSRDVARARRVAERLRCGTVNINEGYGAAYASHDAPMGGMKASGQGRRHGEHGLLEYTELQTVASQHLIGFDPLPWLTQQQNSVFLARFYRLMKATRMK